MHYKALYAFHFVYFISFSVTAFLPKYFGEIGLSDGRIGMLLSLPAVVGVLVQPVWGTLTDRIRLKRMLLVGLLAALTLVCFLLDRATGFIALLAGMAAFYILVLPVAPIYATISLEYTREIGKPYGPVRLVGTVGYQAGALLTGVLLAQSLDGVFRLLAVVMLASCAAACCLPPVHGHQHGRAKVPMRALFDDRRLLLLLAMILVGAVTSQFYMAFFAKHLGDLGIDNATTGLMLFVSVAMELPFLLVAHRLARRTSIWNWLLIGYGLNAVRWLGLAVSRSIVPLLLCQIPAVSVMACFEYLPAVYVNERAPEALKGTAQNAVMIVSFGISKVIGSLVGGFVSERAGIPVVFAANGVLLAVAIAVFWRPTRKAILAEKET